MKIPKRGVGGCENRNRVVSGDLGGIFPKEVDGCVDLPRN